MRLEDLLGDIEIEDPIFKTTRENIWNQKKFAEMLEYNPNLITLCNSVHYFEEVEPEKDTKKHRAFINLLKLITLEFENDPYYNSRIGWFLWFLACYARYDSYYPMRWCFHYDPLNWYRVDEPRRPRELERILPEDPFNIRGQVWIHPEWYINPEVDSDKTSTDTEEPADGACGSQIPNT